MNLYEFECLSCDLVMQIQLTGTIEVQMACICGSILNKVFCLELEEPVFDKNEDIIYKEE